MTYCVYISPTVRAATHEHWMCSFKDSPYRQGLTPLLPSQEEKGVGEEEKNKELFRFRSFSCSLELWVLCTARLRSCLTARTKWRAVSALLLCSKRVCTSMWRSHIVYNTSHLHRRKCALCTELCATHKMSRRRKAPTLLGEGAMKERMGSVLWTIPSQMSIYYILGRTKPRVALGL